MAGPILPLITFSNLLSQGETIITPLPASMLRGCWPAATFLVDVTIPVLGPTFTVSLIYYHQTPPVSPILYTTIASLTGITTNGLKRIPLTASHSGDRVAPPMPSHLLTFRQAGGVAAKRVISGTCHGVFSGTGTKVQEIASFAPSLVPATEVFFDLPATLVEGGWPAMGAYMHVTSFSSAFTANLYAQSQTGADLLVASGSIVGAGWTPLTPSVDFASAPGAFPTPTRIGFVSAVGGSYNMALNWCRASE